MTDPTNADTTEAPGDEEIALENLDTVSGGTRPVTIGSESIIMGTWIPT
jgi:hypothetical protein